MKTYLVPVDFSKASVHAAKFAAALSHQTEVEHIILLNAYYVSVYETMLPSPDMVLVTEEDIEQNATDRTGQLESLKVTLEKVVRPGVTISTHLIRSHLVRAIVENAISKNADLVIVGSVGNSSRDDVKIGSHIARISKFSPVPVIIVPPEYDFKNVSRVVVACDFNKVTEDAPLASLKKLLDRRKFDLLVVNVDSKSEQIPANAEQAAQDTPIYATLKPYSPEYHFVSETNVIHGILHFAAEKDAQLVIALPHKYSFLQSLMHTSVSQQLAASSAVPVLLLK